MNKTRQECREQERKSTGRTKGDGKEENPRKREPEGQMETGDKKKGKETGRKGQMETEVGVWVLSDCPGVGLPVCGDGQGCLT